MKREQEFLRLLKEAIEVCQKAKEDAISKGETWMIEDAMNAQEQFKKISEQVRSGNLEPSNGGGLGITRSLGEWAPDYLYAAGEVVEKFYMQEW